MAESAFEMEIIGLDRLLAAFKGMFEEVANSPEIMKAMAVIGKNIENQAKSILDDKIYSQPASPSYNRTQQLKGRTTSDSPGHDADGNPHVKVRSRQHYAPYIELGTGIHAESGKGRQTPWVYKDLDGNWHYTRGMKARPFLRPAAQEQAEASLKILETALSKFLKSKATT